MSTPTIQCPLCNDGARLVTVRHEVTVGRRRVLVDDEYMHCASCDESFYTPEQSEQLETRAREAVARAENLLSGDEIGRIRRDLHLTQPMFEQLLGVGEKTCARWETGKVRPNVATDRLIRLLAADRGNAKILAALHGVTLPDACFVPSAAATEEWSPSWPGTTAHLAIPSTVRIEGNREPGTPDPRELSAIVDGIVGTLPMRKLGKELLAGSFLIVPRAES
ncbi:MAG TPA: type II TA system antitoxin MqsA family protein [Sphingomicrobium sp.]|nr:type II TA system antitoxin MqsA family protein [Sphingomicrobium sp.]